ncbi:MAG: cytochrome b N-terminal domain-containing protein [Candidatus Brocadiales bacterium]
MSEELKKAKDKVVHTQAWRSVFRQGWPTTDRNRILTTLNTLLLHLHPLKVRTHALKIQYTFCLGGLTLFLFVIETITGVILMFYYRPTIEYAYQDIKDLEFTVTFGLFLRNMHRWAGHAMVISVIFHMSRVFYTGSYKSPREFNWLIGVQLLVLTLLLSFTGYLLPWDQLALWAVTVGTNMGKATPILGAEGPFAILPESSDVAFYLRGSVDITQNTLLRFYVLHCIALPLAAAGLMGVHFWRIRKDGGISGPL